MSPAKIMNYNIIIVVIHIHLQDSWDSVKSIVSFYTSHQDEFQPAAGPGHWNDPDMVHSITR